ncbi:hypothetical protein [Mucilaginibacter sp. AK015]|nr:hypothetical protein [Mucilaginibacter sp. AK015]MBB5396803.1 hypothetical protein [Mucilaginibacter sp. AK015]
MNKALGGFVKVLFAGFRLRQPRFPLPDSYRDPAGLKRDGRYTLQPGLD